MLEPALQTTTHSGLDGLAEEHSGSAPFLLEVAKSFEEISLDRSAWDTSVASLSGSVYMTWDWLRTWWQYYGEGSELRLIVCSAGREVVGLIPVYIQNVGRGPFKLRVARLVGANIPPKVFDPPIARAWASDCLDALIRRLLETDGCDLLSFGPISETCEAWRALPDAVARRGGAVRLECDNSEVHTIFRLPQTLNEYLGSLGKNEQKNRRKYELRTLKKAYDVNVAVVSGPVDALVAEFDNFAALHSEQWQAEGKSGHFGAWPEGLAYNRALVLALGPLDRVRFLRIRANGETVMSQYIFAFAGRWYWELPARSPEPQWARFSLGPSGIVTMICHAIGAGVRWIQGGLGHYDYKLQLEAEEHSAPRCRVYPSRVGSRLRLTACRAVCRLLRLIYHKMWYRRVMPMLPAHYRRPQWRLWLRWDF